MMTRQSALMPQEPGQGSLHFWLIQASCGVQSLLLTHSGRQLGADPTYPERQLHEGEPAAVTTQELYGPHGDGTQGSRGVTGDVGTGSAAVGQI